MNLQIAQVYLQHADSALAARTWQEVMEKIISMKTSNTRERWEYAIQDKAFDPIRNRKLLETSSEHFLEVLQKGSVSTNVYLRRAHNFAIGMNWLPWPVLPRLQWPPVRFKEKRAITFEEHQTIINRERNPEIKAFYHVHGELPFRLQLAVQITRGNGSAKSNSQGPEPGFLGRRLSRRACRRIDLDGRDPRCNSF